MWYHFGLSSPITWLAVITIVGLLSAMFAAHYLPQLFEKKPFKHKTVNHTVSQASPANPSNSRTSNKKSTRFRWLTGLYAAVWVAGLGWFFSIEPKQERDWMAEVEQQVAYERDATNPDLITLTNVRNFDWRTDEDATEHWETRTIDLSKLSGVDVTNSYWMGPLIAHTLVSFRFDFFC